MLVVDAELESAKVELLRAAAEVCLEPVPALAIREAFDLGDYSASDYTDVFVLDLVPHGSIYLSEFGELGGEAQERISDFYGALGADSPKDVDSLGSLLMHYSELISLGMGEESHGEGYLAYRKIRAGFLYEHILSWVPVYLEAARSITSSLSGWAEALFQLFRDEIAILGLGEWHQLPRALLGRTLLRYEGSQVELDKRHLLSPWSSGVVLSKSALFSCAKEVGAAPRIGTRSLILDSLLGQDGEATIEWLAKEAQRQADLWIELEATLFGSMSDWGAAALNSRQYLLSYLS